jgi:hypothetical protein
MSLVGRSCGYSRVFQEGDLVKFFPKDDLSVHERSFLPRSVNIRFALESIVHFYGYIVTTSSTYGEDPRLLICMYPPSGAVQFRHPMLLSSSDSNWSNNCDYRCRGWDFNNDCFV